MKKSFLLVVLFLFALNAHAQSHSATLTWNASTNQVNVYKSTGGNSYSRIAPLLSPGVTTYVDQMVNAGDSVSYYLTAEDSNSIESIPSNIVAAVIPGGVTPPPPTCTTIAVGCRIKTNSATNVRQAPTSSTAPPAQYGCPSACATVPSGALGTILSISQFGYTPYGVTNWIQVQFDSAPATVPNGIGYMGNNNLTLVNTAPVVAVSISPTSATILAGATQQFTATVMNDPVNSGVVWSTNAPMGLFTAPASAGTATVTATSVSDPTKKASATVTITLPPLAINCQMAAVGVTNLSTGSYQMTVTQGSRNAVCTGTK